MTWERERVKSYFSYHFLGFYACNWLALEYATQFHFFFNYLVKLFGKGNLVYRGSCVLRSYVWSTILNSVNSFWRSPKIFGIERVNVIEVLLAAMKFILFYTCSQIELLLFMKQLCSVTFETNIPFLSRWQLFC